MSLIIKGMEMPNGTRKAEFARDADGHLICVVEPDVYYPDDDQSPMIYDIVEIPTPHERLIDADALMAKFERMETAFLEHGRPFSFSFKDGGEMCAEWWIVQDALSREPTIIEAEGGTENADPAD